MLNETRHLPPRLPAETRGRVQQAILSNASPTTSRQCGIYPRAKGSASEPSSYLRSGTEIEEYIPALDFLVERGYRVLVVGDHPLSHSVRLRFGRAVMDYTDVPVERDLYNLHVSTECDFFIGEAGGGCWLSGLNGRPTLMLNAFPFFVALPSTQLYYKSAHYSDGTPMKPQDMFDVFYFRLGKFYDGQFNITLNNNTKEEVMEAVCHFVPTIGQEGAGIFPSFIDGLPDD